MNTTKEILKKYRSNILAELEKTEQILMEQYASEPDFIRTYINKLFSYTQKGKLLRGSFAILFYDIFTQNSESKDLHKVAAEIAVALELNQSALLMHDDIMDEDDMRRGEDAMHVYFQKNANKKGASENANYGISASIALGDVTLFVAQQKLSNLQVLPEKKAQLMAFYNENILEVGIGQIKDYEFGMLQNGEDEPSQDDIKKLYLQKTAAYSCVLPFVLGAILADCSDETLQIVKKFGEHMGYMFQLVDDEISFLYDANITGKPMGNDVKTNKKTFLRLMILEKAQDGDREFVLSCFGNKNVHNEDLKRLQEIYISSGVKELMTKEVEEQYTLATGCVSKLNVSTDFQKTLKDICTMLRYREK